MTPVTIQWHSEGSSWLEAGTVPPGRAPAIRSRKPVSLSLSFRKWTLVCSVFMKESTWCNDLSTQRISKGHWAQPFPLVALQVPKLESKVFWGMD